MNRYTARSSQQELIDQPGIPFKDWYVCLKELNIINTYLGGHTITLKGVKHFAVRKNLPVSIAEIGCGGGDNLKAIYRWANQNEIPATFTGIDMNEACIDFAAKNCAEIKGIELIASDYRYVDFKGSPPDIIFSSLFCHHFSNDQLVDMLRWLKKNTKQGFFINDLQRHPVAFHSIKWLTQLFSHSYLVKNDAPISVLRGFKAHEWKALLKAAGITHYSIQWKWAFRFLIVVKHG